ncbi:MAG: hypothetical protein VCE74_05410 [Alphaproteobacteria bacterium]
MDNQFTQRPDYNGFLSVNFRHTYDPQVHSGDVLETDLLIYVSQQTNQHQLDLVFTELSVGPRGQFLREYVESASWRPHIVASIVHLDNSHYYHAIGAGIDIDKQFSQKTNGSVATSVAIKKYRADAGRTTARLQNGTEADLEFSVFHQAMENLMFTTSAGVKNSDAVESLNGNTEFSFGLGASLTHDPLFKIKTGAWTTSFNAEVLYSRYHAPDPSVNSIKRRKDTEIRGTLLTSIPVTEELSITTTLARTVVDSNFLNYSYTNWSATFGVSKRF